MDYPEGGRKLDLVDPGTDVHQGDAGWTSPALDAAARRRPRP